MALSEDARRPSGFEGLAKPDMRSQGGRFLSLSKFNHRIMDTRTLSAAYASHRKPCSIELHRFAQPRNAAFIEGFDGETVFLPHAERTQLERGALIRKHLVRLVQ